MHSIEQAAAQRLLIGQLHAELRDAAEALEGLSLNASTPEDRETARVAAVKALAALDQGESHFQDAVKRGDDLKIIDPRKPKGEKA